MTNNVVDVSVTWCAASIAHDAYHSKLYRDYPAANTGKYIPADIWARKRKGM